MSARDAGEQARRAFLDGCNDHIVTLLHEATHAGIPLERVVVLVAADDDPTGRAVIRACARIGPPTDGTEVFVAGMPFELATEVLAGVDIDLAERLHPSPPAGSAQVLCIAHGGVLSLFLGVAGRAPEA